MRYAAPVRLTADSAQIEDVLDLVKRTFAYMAPRIDPPSSMTRLTADSIKEQCVSGEVWAIGEPPYACVFLSEKDGKLYIGKLAVDGERRGQGCARRLVELAEERAASMGLTILELETRIELLENHETFRRLGFKKTGEGAHDGFDRPTYIVMHKAI